MSQELIEFVAAEAKDLHLDVLFCEYPHHLRKMWGTPAMDEVRSHFIVHDKKNVFVFLPSAFFAMPVQFAEATLEFPIKDAISIPRRAAIDQLTKVIRKHSHKSESKGDQFALFRELCALAAALVRCYVWSVVNKQAPSPIYFVSEDGIQTFCPLFSIDEDGDTMASLLCFFGIPSVVTHSKRRCNTKGIAMHFGQKGDFNARLLILIAQ